MPIVIGYASPSEVDGLKRTYDVFYLRHDQAKGLGIGPKRKSDKLVMAFIPMSKYNQMDYHLWDNTYIIDERDKQEQLELGL